MKLIHFSWGILFGISLPTLATQSISSYDLPKTLIKSDKKIFQGGFGSDAAVDPQNNRRFYALTDRGPNIDGNEKGTKIFPIPDYTPSIGHFAFTQDNSIMLLKRIELKNPEGKKLTGLPNPQGLGATGEIALDNNKKPVGTDPYGIDSEGLAIADDGSFWVSDEYGPHIVHFNSEGVELERISPYGVNTQGRKLPAIFAKRRANRGMEGLTLTPDQTTLVGIMQSTLFNPSKKEAINRTLTRIVTFDLTTGKTKQFLYQQNADNLSNSSIIALNNYQFLVGERDGKFAGIKSAAQKHVYLIDIRNATDISGDSTAPTGLLLNGKTLEQSSWEEINQAGIKTVSKRLVLEQKGYAKSSINPLLFPA
ncbi:esterase-like activity of phytase family protein [Pasteurellaceae bacterium TAE3-ERU1]|nr:esterase-like activity of phytase family protein [Pasteurellaceae bacterium TAE3-ERU1]